MRWSYFKYTIPEKERFDPLLIKAGKEAEEIAYRYLSKRYKVKRCKNREIHFKGFSLAGRGDFIAMGSDSHLVEVKSSKWLRDKPELRWLAQLNIYLFLENFESGILLEVIGKSAIRTMKIRFNPELLRKSLLYFSSLKQYIVREEIPKARHSYRCKYCSYRHVCAIR